MTAFVGLTVHAAVALWRVCHPIGGQSSSARSLCSCCTCDASSAARAVAGSLGVWESGTPLLLPILAQQQGGGGD
jgi:hypothetical protein